MEIIIRDLSKSYGGRPVLSGLNMTFTSQSPCCLMSPSGSGKTTLLSVMGGIELPTSGQVFVDGEDITACGEKRRAILRRTQLGFSFQFFNLAPYLTVEQNIMVPLFLAGKRKRTMKTPIDELLEFVGLSDKRKSLPGKLSGGEQQRVAIARGLVFRPDIIFLDEPTGNLDSVNSESIMQLLSRINAEFGTTVVQVTHNEKNADYGTRVITISDGRILSSRDVDKRAGSSKTSV